MAASLTLFVDIHEPEEIQAYVEGAGIPVERKTLAPGDYIVGEVGVERKTINDFFASIVNKRLWEQVYRLRDTYPRPLVLVEGDLGLVDEYDNPKVFWGAFLALHFQEGVPVLFAPNYLHTAMVLETLYRHQLKAPTPFSLRYKPKKVRMPDRQEFAVQGLPNIGDTLAKALLERFGSVRRVMAASERELMKVPKIGPGKATRIAELLDAPYEGTQQTIEE
ncbi:MAG: ERCC4 domain-containing protein [Thermoplasmata archaeon]|nr:ERCC4 domain-containing protein [Thermoplasmata archaeon]